MLTVKWHSKNTWITLSINQYSVVERCDVINWTVPSICVCVCACACVCVRAHTIYQTCFSSHLCTAATSLQRPLKFLHQFLNFNYPLYSGHLPTRATPKGGCCRQVWLYICFVVICSLTQWVINYSLSIVMGWTKKNPNWLVSSLSEMNCQSGTIYCVQFTNTQLQHDSTF